MDDVTFWWSTVGLSGLCGLVMERAGTFRSAEQTVAQRLRKRLRHQQHSEQPGRLDLVMRRLDELRDLRRLLIIAGESPSPTRWAKKVLGATLVTLAVVVGLDAVTYSTSTGLLIPVDKGLLLAGSIPPLSVLMLVRKVARRRRIAGQSLGEALPVFSGYGQRPLRDPATVDAGDPLAGVAQLLVDKTLWSMVQDDAWKQLVPVAPRTPSEFFDRFAAAYGVPEARRYAAALRNATEESAASLELEFERGDELYQVEDTAKVRKKGRSRLITSTIPGVGILASLVAIILRYVVLYGPFHHPVQ